MKGTAKGLSFLIISLLTLPAGAELLMNGDFEAFVINRKEQRAYPESWGVFTALNGTNRVTMTRSIFRSGRQSVRIRAQEHPQAYQGLFQTIDVEELRIYDYTAYVTVHAFDQATPPIRGFLTIDWLDADENVLRRDQGERWDHTLDPKRWHRYRLSSRAPEGSVRATFSIVQEDGRIGTGSGSFFIDDATVTTRGAAVENAAPPVIEDITDMP